MPIHERMHQRIDMTGMRYGALRVIEDAGNYDAVPGHKSALWLCRCDCGQEVIVRGASLRAGATRSCGCRRIAANRARSANGSRR